MLSGQNTTSIRKQDLSDQKNIGTGFIKTQFANQFSGGETGTNLNSLTLPASMASLGFVNPSAAQLAAANLTSYRRNLKLVYVSGSTRKDLVDFIDYTVSATGSQINFIGITATTGDILVGTLDYTAVNGIQVVSATGQPAWYSATAAQTDFNVGYPVPTNQYSTTRMGGVLVYKNGTLQYRNTGNSSTVTDGNYYEVDNGSGNFSVIRFNSGLSSGDKVQLIPNGLLVPQPDGSLLTTVQAQAGQINQLAAYVASLAGQSTTTVLGGAASYTDLLAFGNLVNTINNTYANLTKSNTWTAAQPLVGVTDGSSAAAGQVGEVKSTITGLAITASTTWSAAGSTSITLTPGDWDISATATTPSVSATGTNVFAYVGTTQMTTGSATPTGTTVGYDYVVAAINVTQGVGLATIPKKTVSISTTTTYYLGVRSDQNNASAWALSMIARRVR